MINLFYRLLSAASRRAFGTQQMLHYPLAGGSNLLEGQQRFSDRCMSYLPDVRGSRLLDVGCGNGVQTIYIHRTYGPDYSLGIDISQLHIDLANQEKQAQGLKGIDFAVDDAQIMAAVPTDSFDVALCTESAHNYRDKAAFLSQLKRALNPGGRFVIAELLRRGDKPMTFVERRFGFFHWTLERYRQTFATVGLRLLSEEDITEPVVEALGRSDVLFTNVATHKSVSYRLSRTFGRGFLAASRRRLNDYVWYCLLVGEKPVDRRWPTSQPIAQAEVRASQP
jgi:SAM-dependent methyltransferase